MVSRLFGSGSGPMPQGGDVFNVFQREVNRVFDEVFRGFPVGRGATATGGFTPSLDVHETEQGLELSAELPGLSEQDIELRIEGDLMTLSGEKKEEQTRDQGGLHLTERSFGRFQRSFRLPFRPDPGQVQAEFDRGILRIVLPRPQQQQAGGRIQIRGSSGQQQSGQASTQGTIPDSAGQLPQPPSAGAGVSPQASSSGTVPLQQTPSGGAADMG